MAFKPKNEEIKKALDPKKKGINKEIILPTFQENAHEKTKAYPFTLQPSVRKRIDELASEQGYKSASKFVNDFFKNL